MSTFATNLRRLLARQGLTLAELAQRAKVDLRTIKNLLNGTTPNPRSRTLHDLAAALEADVDEFFQNSSTLTHRHFDRKTNPVVTEVVESQPQLFEGWSEAEFAELYSRQGMGGALTAEGALEAVRLMNRKRQVLKKVQILLESDEQSLLCAMVDALYDKVVVSSC
jgi:transcriptional regulator with XRE-family HTH domain